MGRRDVREVAREGDGVVACEGPGGAAGGGGAGSVGGDGDQRDEEREDGGAGGRGRDVEEELHEGEAGWGFEQVGEVAQREEHDDAVDQAHEAVDDDGAEHGERDGAGGVGELFC